MLTSKEFAEIYGIPQRTVRQSMKAGVLKRGKKDGRIDAMSEAASEFLQKHRSKPKQTVEISKDQETTEEKKVCKKGIKQKTAKEINEALLPKDIRDLGHKSLNELLEIFGTANQFKEFLQSKKLLEDIAEKSIKNKLTENEVIKRDFVSEHLFRYIQESNSTLLNQAPLTITSDLWDLFDSGGTREEGTQLVTEIISSHIKNVKRKTIECLKKSG